MTARLRVIAPYLAVAIIATMFSSCHRRSAEGAEHADYRVRAIDEFERLTATKDYIYSQYLANEYGKRAAAIRSIDRQIQRQPAASLDRIETAFHDSISPDIISGELFPLEPGTRLKYLETSSPDPKEPVLKFRVLDGEHRGQVVFHERARVEHLGDDRPNPALQ
jgi:hypothetical protein